MELLLIERSLKTILSALVLIFTATTLQPLEYGTLSLAVSIGSISSIFLLFGLGQFLKVELDHGRSTDYMISIAERLRIPVYILSFLLFSISVYLFSQGFYVQALICQGVACYSISSDLYEVVLLKQARSRLLAKRLFSFQIVDSLSKLIAVYLFKSAYAYILADMLVRLLRVSFLRRIITCRKTAHEISVHDYLAFLLKSIPFLLTSLACVGLLRIDQLFISAWLGDSPNGIYSVAVSISETFNFVPIVVVSTLSPSVFLPLPHLFDQQQLKRMNRLLLAVAAALSACLFLSSQPLINLLFGTSYVQSIKTLQILSPTVFLWSIIVFQSSILGHARFQRHDLVRNIAACALNILLNVCLVPSIGINGAAIATLLSLILMIIYGHLVIRRIVFPFPRT